MNLMFRKNFRDQKAGVIGGKGAKTAVGRHTSKRCSREQGYSAMEEHHYRTHLFFNPPRATYTGEETDDDSGSNCLAVIHSGRLIPMKKEIFWSPYKETMKFKRALVEKWKVYGVDRIFYLTEPRCGPMTGAGGDPLPAQSSMSPAMTESDMPPQPLVRRSPSASMMRCWQSLANTQVHHATPNRQVSFNYANDGNNTETARTLSGLDRDCFIIPVHSLDRFLPAGVPMPKPPANGNSLEKKGNLHVMEVPDPKLCVLCHLMSPLEPIDPVLESPLVQPLFKQRVTAGELVNEVAQAKTAVTGMLLANMEKNAEFPFITYYVINTSQTNPVMFYNNLRTASLTKFDPRATRYTAAHTLDLYSEVASICRPPIHEIGMSLSKTHTTTTGYMVSVYKVFEGDDREKFERNWLYWTGARMIYRYLPSAAGLRRISLHKSLSPKGDKMYILLCECANLLNDITVCALLLPALRARLTGYTGIFRPLQTF